MVGIGSGSGTVTKSVATRTWAKM